MRYIENVDLKNYDDATLREVMEVSRSRVLQLAGFAKSATGWTYTGTNAAVPGLSRLNPETLEVPADYVPAAMSSAEQAHAQSAQRGIDRFKLCKSILAEREKQREVDKARSIEWAKADAQRKLDDAPQRHEAFAVQCEEAAEALDLLQEIATAIQTVRSFKGQSDAHGRMLSDMRDAAKLLGRDIPSLPRLDEPSLAEIDAVLNTISPPQIQR